MIKKDFIKESMIEKKNSSSKKKRIFKIINQLLFKIQKQISKTKNKKRS
jgi:hypothetical protein